MGVSRGPDTTVLDFFFFALCAATTSDTSSIIMTITLFMVMSFMVTREKKKFPKRINLGINFHKSKMLEVTQKGKYYYS
jgi:preprotein translocase subunit YajC